MTQALIMATLGTLFTFFMTSAGAATVYFFKREPSENITRVFLGFAAGVMIAASVWSLLIPAIDMTEEAQRIGWIPAAGAMIYVTVEELIPEAHLGEHSHFGTLGVIFGFIIMMILDVALG